jgi:hypothetical protein
MKKPMTRKEAIDLQAAFVAGYVEPDNAELKEAEKVTGRRAIVKEFVSTANKDAVAEIRTLGGKRDS